VLWVGSLLYAGYWFGNVPFVKDNLGWVILAIVAVSLAPIVVEYVRHRARRGAAEGGG
jgi:membrane-associated protein